MEEGYIHPRFNIYTKDKPENGKGISYSQYSKWATCPLRWKLDKIDKLEPFSQSIHTIFGTSMHETIQHYLTVLYTKSVKEADSIDLHKMLKEQLGKEFTNAMENNGGELFTTPKELEEFYIDGITILDYFKRKRSTYFNSRNLELIAIEFPIMQQASPKNPNVYMVGFLDLIILDKSNNKITIIDIKTSTKGWSKWEKADKLKTSQLVLYKKYFSEQTGYDLGLIDIKYFILRRKIDEESLYPMKRIQEFLPASGKPTINRLVQSIDTFVSECFNEDGTYNTERKYVAIAGERKKNCKFCPFVNDNTVCPKENRMC